MRYYFYDPVVYSCLLSSKDECLAMWKNSHESHLRYAKSEGTWSEGIEYIRIFEFPDNFCEDKDVYTFPVAAQTKRIVKMIEEDCKCDSCKCEEVDDSGDKTHVEKFESCPKCPQCMGNECFDKEVWDYELIWN